MQENPTKTNKSADTDFAGASSKDHARGINYSFSDDVTLLRYVDQKIDAWKRHIDDHTERLSEKSTEKIVELVKRRSWIAAGILVVGGGSLIFTAYKTVNNYVEKIITTRLDAKFSEANIQTTIADEARKFTADKASSMIKDQLADGLHATKMQVDAAGAAMSAALTKTESEQRTRLAQIQSEQIDVATHIDTLKRTLEDTSEVYRIGSLAINGSYPNYVRLLGIASDKQIAPIIRSTADLNVAQINRLLRNYIKPFPPFLATVTYAEGEKKIDANSLDAKGLIARMEDPGLTDASREILAAYLQKRPALEIIEQAIDAFQSNKNLYSLVTLFGRVTQESGNGRLVFGDTDAIVAAFKAWKARELVKKKN
jgi:hypothetical protein